MPDTPEQLQTDQTPFIHFWVLTKLGTRYVLPDMLPQHVTVAHKQLDFTNDDQIVVVTNISNVVLSIPKRIIASAGAGDRCFWEAR